MNITTKSRQSASRIALTQQEILDTRQLAAELAMGHSDRQILTMMGMLNVYIRNVALAYGVIDDDSTEINLENWYTLVNSSAEGQVGLTVATDWMSGYLKQHWPRAYYSENTIRKYRQLFLDLRLFTYDVENRPKGAYWGYLHQVPMQGVATPPDLEKVDVARMLIIYQTFDQVIRQRHLPEEAFEIIPDHGGKLMVVLYNALFNGERDFRGGINRECDLVVPERPAMAIKKQIVWAWKKFFGLSRKQWQRLVTRAGHVYEDVVRDKQQEIFASVSN